MIVGAILTVLTLNTIASISLNIDRDAFKEFIRKEIEAEVGHEIDWKDEVVEDKAKTVTVQAHDVGSSPSKTGVTLQKGQRFKLIPSSKDEWTGGGTKAGVFCNYLGYTDRADWMRMMWKWS